MYKSISPNLNFVEEEKKVEKFWEDENIFEKSIAEREGDKPYVFYDGPPTANGKPHIGHVLTRVIKDMIPRYRTMKGYMVPRKAGWDTHGLPVELEVEKLLGLDGKEQIEQYGLEPFIEHCKESVWKYKGMWEDFSKTVGFWADMEHPYVTYDNNFIESEWWALKKIYEKGLLYKGFKIVPYCPRCGTPLSSHEVAQGYKNVKERSAVVRFKVVGEDAYFLAWTTTPWTLPSNVALCVNPEETYCKVKAADGYTYYMAKALLDKVLGKLATEEKPAYEIIEEYKGSELEYKEYEPLFDCVKPVCEKQNKKGHYITCDTYVTMTDGTGIVHIAPAFGEDDAKVGRRYDLPFVQFVDGKGNLTEETPYAGIFVKKADPLVLKDLDEKGLLFDAPKFEHDYPYCWRCDTPLIYYARESWFIKMTAVRDKLIEYNQRINWLPETIKDGRMGNFLENVIDWGLSRERYWGTPLPIWVSEDGTEKKCIGSVAELVEEIEKSIQAGFMQENPYQGFIAGDYSKENYDKIDLHRPYVDDIILVSDSGQKMYREKDLIDVWFDSGAMPYAQLHYPFEHREDIDQKLRFPADFIAEGVDQTRGWFFTLHAIATMAFDSVAFKNIISNGLVLDAKGNKMSKRLGNAVDPFSTIATYGSDPLRWYMITNSQPWDNLKFDMAGIDEVKRKFFGTLYNTYGFFALYANVDHFRYAEAEVAIEERPEIDRWILSLLNSLIKEVTEAYEKYEPTRAGRAIQDFVIENLSNWYVRLSRKRYWGGEYSQDKISAYQTLYTCLETIAILSAPIAPFYMEKLFGDLNKVTGRHSGSVHLADFPKADEKLIDNELEERMELAQQISSMVLGLRRKVQLRVRQPLSKLIIPILNDHMIRQLDAVKNIILSEVNVKEIEYITDTTDVLVKKIKPNFKTLGPKYGKYMKQISTLIAAMEQSDIFEFEKNGRYQLNIGTEPIDLSLEDVEILSEDIPGWLVANEGRLTVALDINVTKELKEEGIARELINRIQNLRKESNFDVTDKITLAIGRHKEINEAVENFSQYIASQVLAEHIELTDEKDDKARDIEIDDIHTFIKIERIN